MLHYASRGGNIAVIQYLVDDRHVDMTSVTECGLTALDVGASDLDVARVLLSYGCDDLQASSKTLCAAVIRANVDVMKQLVASGTDVNQMYLPDEISEIKVTALLMAAFAGKLEAAEYLCENGADVELMTECGESALFMAASRGHLGIVKYLVENQHANVESANWLGMTPAEVAKAEEQDHVLAYLLERGATPPKFEMMHFQECESFRDTRDEEARLTTSERVSITYWEREDDLRLYLEPLEN